MRPKILLICGVALAACFVLVYRSSLSSAPSQPGAENGVQSVNGPVPGGTATAPEISVAVQPSAFDWQLRFSEIVGQPDFLQSELLEEMAATFPENQMHGALDDLAAQKSDSAMILIELLVQRWATNSPASAAEWVEAHLIDNDSAHNVFNRIVVPWAQEDLAGAVAWAQQLPAGENKTAAVSSLAFEAALQKQALTAISLTRDIPSGAERDNLLIYVTQQWATTDRDSAITWINQVEELTLREEMLGKVAVNLGAEDPLAAAEIIVGKIPPGPVRDDALVDVIRFWAASAPENAVAWVQQLPEVALRNTAIENVFDVWRRGEPNTDGAWSAGKVRE
jgi:hypothetical protein